MSLPPGWTVEEEPQKPAYKLPPGWTVEPDEAPAPQAKDSAAPSPQYVLPPGWTVESDEPAAPPPAYTLPPGWTVEEDSSPSVGKYLTNLPALAARETNKAIGQIVTGAGDIVKAVPTLAMEAASRAAVMSGDLTPEEAAQRKQSAMAAVNQSPYVVGATGTQEFGKQLGREGFGAVMPGVLAKDPFEVDPGVEQSLPGKIVSGGASMAPAIATGPAAPVTMGLMMGAQGKEDAEAKGATEAQQAAAVLGNAAVGGVSEAALGVPALFKSMKAAKAVKDVVGREAGSALGRVAVQTAKGAAREGAQEGLEQLTQNVLAKDVIGYDPERDRTEGVAESAAIGGLIGGGVSGTFHAAQEYDTGKNVPESPKTLQAQQEDLIAGKRTAQMFPLNTPELELPPGMERVETERGVFHYNPEAWTADEITALSASAKENVPLGLGSLSKPEVEARAAATGEEGVVITERRPDGTEVKAAVGTTATAPKQVAELEASKADPKNTIKVESVSNVVQKRVDPSFVDELIGQSDKAAEAAKARDAAELEARAKRQAELDAKKARFGETIQLARQTYDNRNASYAQLQGALESMKFYAEDNAIGLTAEQRRQAESGHRALVKRIAPLQVKEDLRLERARVQLETEQKTAEAAAKASRAERRAADRAAIAAERTGPRPDGTFNYSALVDDKLVELAQNGDQHAERELMERESGARTPQAPDLLETIRKAKIRIPTVDESLQGELNSLRENFTPREWNAMTTVAPGAHGGLDYIAEKLRTEHGFSQIQTPADLVDHLDRASRGEDIRPQWQGNQQVDFAAARRIEPISRGISEESINSDIVPVQLPPEKDWHRVNSENRKLIRPEYKEERTFENSAFPSPLKNYKSGKKVISDARDRHGFRLLKVLPDVVRNAVYLTTEPDNEHRAEVKWVHRLAGAVSTEIGILPVKLTVLEKTDGDFVLYGAELNPNKRHPIGNMPSDSTSAAPNGLKSDARIKVRDLLHNVKRLPDGTFSADFAQNEAAPAQAAKMPPAELARLEADVRARFPRFFSEVDLQIGRIEDMMLMRDPRATVPPGVEGALIRQRGRRTLLALQAAALQNRRHASSLLMHEAAHAYWDTLPEDTKAMLRELHAEQVAAKSGPLYKDGVQQSRLRGVEDVSSEFGHKEWFAESLAAINREWALARINGPRSHSTLARLAEQLRAWFLKTWAQLTGNADMSLMRDHFRQFILEGADQNVGRSAGMAYAQKADYAQKKARAKADFASRGSDEIDRDLQATRAKLEALKESQEDEEVLRTEGTALQSKLTALTKEHAQAKQEEAVAASLVPAEDYMHPLAKARDKIERGDAWASVAKMDLKEIVSEKAAIKEALATRELDALSNIEIAGLQSRMDALQAAHGRLVDGILGSAPKVSPAAAPASDERKAKLLADLERGENIKADLRDIGHQRLAADIISTARKALDAEFPGWNGEQAAQPEAQPEEAHQEPDPVFEERSPFDPAEGDEALPLRPGIAAKAYGQSSVAPGIIKRTEEWIVKIGRGFRGPIPELPVFPALDKTDKLLRQHGAYFYNRVKEFYRFLSGANDYIQSQASEKLSSVITILMRDPKAPWNPDAYDRLKKIQSQIREAQAKEGGVASADLVAEANQLQAQLEQHPYMLFQETILMLDLRWRARNIQDSDGAPIKLPFGMTLSEVEAELDRLKGLIAANPNALAVKDAINAHKALVAEVMADLKKRDLITAENIENPFYFPHLALERNRGGQIEQVNYQPAKVHVDLRQDYRGYLKTPIGSETAIESDYLKAMYYHLVQVGAHNTRADAVQDFIKPYDILAQIKAEAKKRGVAWEVIYHNDYKPLGYVVHGLDAEDAFPVIQIDRDKLARTLGVAITSEDIQEQLKRLGNYNISLTRDDIKQVYTEGAREVWVIPARVSDSLKGIEKRSQISDEAIAKAFRKTLSAWKGNKLFAPWNHMRYEFGNITSDLQKLIASSPSTFREIPESYLEVARFFRGELPTDDLRAALKQGVINSITAQEMGALTRLPQFQEFETTAEKLKRTAIASGSTHLIGALSAAFGPGHVNSVELSAFREAVFRYANYKASMKALLAGVEPQYGGAYHRDIKVMTDSRPGAGDALSRKAAAISLATFGNYGEISANGQWMRTNLMAFYSWIEVNFKFHANLLRNTRDMIVHNEAGGRAKGVAIAVRLLLPFIALALWNDSDENRELEALLSEEDRRRTHLIIGRTPDGKVEVMYLNTAIGDIMRWFSGQEFARQFMRWQSGQTDFATAMGAWSDNLAPDLAQNTLGGITPIIKTPVSYVFKREFGTDVLNSKKIPAYDLRRAILSQITDNFVADQIERVVNKDYVGSKDLVGWAKQLILQVRERDPESWAFYSIRDKAEGWVADRTGKDRDSSMDSPDAQVVRNFKRAIFRGDVEAATNAYVSLLGFGYTAERMAAMVRAQDPLNGVPKQLRTEFVASLAPDERVMLQRAYAYATRLTASRGEEVSLFPKQRQLESGLDPKPYIPQNVNRLQGIIERRDRMTEAEIRAQVERDMQESLRQKRK